MFKMEHTVHLSDTDVTGQVYYARPLEWLEWCRVNWFQSILGNFQKYVAETGITFFPSKVTIEYKRPIFFSDALTIEMNVKEIKKVSFILDYVIKRDDAVVCTSEITMVCFNQTKNRLSPLNPEIMPHLEALLLPPA